MQIYLYSILAVIGGLIWWSIYKQNKGKKLTPNAYPCKNNIDDMAEDTELTERDIKRKREYIIKQIADKLKAYNFRKKGNNFFKRNETIGYCFNFQNDRWNNSELIRFTFNLGIHSDKYWLDQMDFKKTGVVSTFPRVSECVIRTRIGQLLPNKGDHWYSITSETDEKKLWDEIDRHLTNYSLPFFEKYSAETISIPEMPFHLHKP